MRIKSVFGLLVTILLANFYPTAFAATGLIDFETVLSSAPVDQLPISTQYQSQFGVIFGLSDGTTPFIEAVGSADVGNGFFNDNLGTFDVAAPGFANQLKNFYLRIGTTSLASAPVPKLIITYTAPVAAASAEIWDIDAQGPGTEQWLVETFDSSGNVNDFVFSPIGTNNGPTSLDGKPWAWSFSHGSSDIYSIQLSFTGTKTNGIGLAFDNFSPSSVSPIPEPTEALLLLCGLAFLFAGKIKLKFRRTYDRSKG
jgi:hypothetical protein